MTNSEFGAALREIAAHYEEHPDMPQPCNTLHIFEYAKDQFITAALELAKGGKIEKCADSPNATLSYYRAIRDFGGVTVEICIPRSTVCTLVSPAVYDCPDSLLEIGKEYGA